MTLQVGWPENFIIGFGVIMLDFCSGGNIENPSQYFTLGHWAGDRIRLIGDYDSSGLYQKAEKEYEDISEKVINEYNRELKKNEYNQEVHKITYYIDK